ncbi:hypothetical protein GCM10009037_14630 [Halarchaeum grantii]|uniref:Uncharacterized protein n=1 Tax=Halarchaeum grantii TaxID=1193105 RepID=A0A830F979_9EURY|nr:hypothetical protein [Halarchaeum grantii]GGL32045.1 hypothetical protein GCM10009037_14630 [Halarchaeum grantii]
MNWKRAFRWAGAYFVWTVLFALVGVALVAGGAYLLAANATPTAVGPATVPVPTSAGLPGLALLVAGVAVYRFGKAWALYRTLTGAVSEDVADTYDTQRVKSDIVSVLDDRLSDMQQDLQSVNREMRELKRESETGVESRSERGGDGSF